MTTHEFPYDRAANKQRWLNGLAQLDNGEPAWPVAKANGISLASFRQRLARGWTGEKAATQPLRADKPNPKPDPWEEMAVSNGVSRRAYRARVRAGISPGMAAH